MPDNRYKNYIFFINEKRKKENAPVITVITACFNNMGLLKTIDSVLSQDYANIEYIIADDCSDDVEVNLKKIEKRINGCTLDSFLSIRMQMQRENVGTVKNINDAIKQATGEIIYFLAADDIFYSEKILSNWTKFFMTNDSLVATAKYCICKNNEKNMQCIRPTWKQTQNIKILSPYELYLKMIYKNYIIGCCTAYRKECFELYGYFDEQYRLLEDHPMILKLLKRDVKISLWDEVAIYYMDNGVSGAKTINEIFESDVERLIKKEAEYLGNDPEWLLQKHRLNKKHLMQFYSDWSTRKYIKAFFVHPKQAVKEILKPFRSMLVKIYMQIRVLKK